MVELKNARAGYEIRDLNLREEHDSYVLSWNYQKGNCFLVIVSSGKESLELGKETANELDACWQELLQEESCSLNGFMVFLVYEQFFAVQDKRFLLKKRDVGTYMPARVQVLSCELSDKISYVYKGRESGAILYIPVSVWVSYKYKKIWFTKNKRCIFSVDPIKDYQDGMLQYCIVDQNVFIPLTKNCIGRDMVVTMSRASSMRVEITKEYEWLYEVKNKQ